MWAFYSTGVESSLEYNRSLPMHTWWMKSDCHEASIMFLWMSFQLINASYVFSFGGSFRENVFMNKSLTVCWCAFNFGLLYLVIAPPGLITCLFRTNCDDYTSRRVRIIGLNLLSFSASGGPFHSKRNSNVFSLEWKVRFLLLNAMNTLVNIFVAKYVLSGPIYKYFRERYFSANTRGRQRPRDAPCVE